MGRFGGHELGFGSDVDVMFVYRARSGVAEEQAQRAASAIAEELRRLLMAPSADPPLDIDADLRPEGRQGPLVRSLDSYASYYERWSATWESQALLRADIAAGDAALAADFMDLVDSIRWQGRLSDDDVIEVRRLKARMEAERLPRGVDPALHTKLGRGGLSDVEWVVQLIQLRHGHELPRLRTTRTLDALEEARLAGLVTDADARQLADAWRLATAIRNAVMLVRGRASDVVPTDVRDLRAVAYVLGYSAEGTGRLVDDYRRTTRVARRVFDRLFYGITDE
jgi:glutamate-ammonia-ligase adenylyltransferase